MAKRQKIEIKESKIELHQALRKSRTVKEEKRVKMIFRLKENPNESRSDLVNYLDVDLSTVNRWIAKYLKNGLSSFYSDRKRNRPSKIITAEISKGLAKRVSNNRSGFSSYKDAKNWVLEAYNVDVNYYTLRMYLIKNFGTKIKSPRRSHVNKAPEAADLFLKSTREI